MNEWLYSLRRNMPPDRAMSAENKEKYPLKVTGCAWSGSEQVGYNGCGA
ncbi:hypothetical protein ACWOQQ_24425 [Enterobacter sp. ESY66]